MNHVEREKDHRETLGCVNESGILFVLLSNKVTYNSTVINMNKDGNKQNIIFLCIFLGIIYEL